MKILADMVKIRERATYFEYKIDRNKEQIKNKIRKTLALIEEI